MGKKLKLLIIMAFLVLGIFLIASNVLAAADLSTLSQCANCHDWSAKPDSDVTKFVLPRLNDGSATGTTVDKTKCQVCHGALIGTSHQGTSLVSVTVDGVVYGNFQNLNSLYQPQAYMHNIHSGVAMYKITGPTCEKCHNNVSCFSCHTTVPHVNHYLASPTNPKTGDPIITPVLRVSTGTARNEGGVIYSYWNIATTCAASECHQTLPAPRRFNQDGSDLCYNCHNTGTTGHDPATLEKTHTASAPAAISILGVSSEVTCTGCHVQPLTTEHMNAAVRDGKPTDIACGYCHGKTASPVVVTVVSGIKTLNKGLTDDTLKAQNRTCTKCHFENLDLIALAGDHPAPLHKATGSDNVNIAGGPHTSCDTCHNRQVPVSVSVTAGTAVEEKTIPQLAFMTEKNYSCLSCHNGNTNPKAPVHSADYNGQQMAVLDVHSSCDTCHTPGSTAASKIDSIITRYPNGGYSCTECHDLSNNHKATFGAMLFNDTTAFHLDCATCHNATYKATITSLKDKVKLGVGYDCAGCHLPTGVKGTSPYYPEHNAGSQEIVGFHPQSCDTCHGVTNGQFKINLDAIRAKLPAPGYACTDCHNGTIAGSGYHQAKTDAAANAETISSTYHAACQTCHGNATVQPVIDRLKGNVSSPYLCSECHNAALNMEPRHSAKLNAVDTAGVTVTSYHVDAAGAVSCGKCHGNTALPAGTITALKAQADYLCTDCHNGNLAPVHSAALTQGGTVQATVGFHSNCQTCHDNSSVKTGIAAGTFAGTYLCTTCHDSVTAPAPNHMAKINDTATPQNISAANHKDCTTCHGNMAYPFVDDIIKQTALNKETNYLCSKCHQTGTALEPKHPVKFTVAESVYADIYKYHKDATGQTACAMCHDHVLPAPDTSGIYVCTDCHEDGGIAVKPLHQATETGFAAGAVDTTVYHSGVSGNSSCRECHETANTALAAKITDLAGQKPTAAYNCSGCHTDLTIKHIDGNLPTWPVNCTWCHSSQLIDTHITPQAIAANSPVNPGSCETCHSPQSPVRNLVTVKTKVCDDCHNANVPGMPPRHPDAEYISRHANKYPVVFSDYKNDCGLCHAQNYLTSLHEAQTPVVSCGTCHTNEQLKPAVLTFNTDCSNCHNPITDTTHNRTIETAHKLPHNVDTVSFPDAAGCLACHSDSAANPDNNLLFVHKFNAATRASATTTVECSSCHGANARAEVKNAVAAKNVACQACHGGASAGHEHPVAATGYAATPNVNCSKCHATNGDGTAELYTIHKNAADAGKIANFSCATCHNGQFEGSVIIKDGKLDLTNIYCTTCHNGTLADALGTKYPAHDGNHINSAGYGVYAGTYNGQSFDDSGVDCAKCHTSLETKVIHDSTVHPNVNCNSCHESTNSAVQAVIAGAWSRAATKADYTCASCHNTLPYKHQADHSAFGVDNVSCNGCHTFNAPQGTAANVTAIHTSSQCNTCHSSGITEVRNFINSNLGQTNPAYNCEACHDYTPVKHNKLHTVTAFTSDGATGCANCHDTDVTVQHSASFKAGLNCDTCHGGNAETVLPGTTAVITANLSSNVNRTGYTCTNCHGNVSHQHQGNILNYVPSGNNTVACQQCHATEPTGSFELVTVHRQAADRGLILNFGCSTCHNDSLVGTGKPIVKDGIIDMKQNGAQDIYCTTCHNGTYADALDTKYPAHSGQHSPDPSGYGTYINTYNGATHDDSNVECSKCHADLKLQGTGGTAHTNVGCNTCHQSANPDVKAVIEGAWSRATAKVDYTCASCHNTLPYKHQPEHVATSADIASLNCAECHSSASWSNNDAQIADIHNGNCNTCHANANSVVSNFIASKKGLSNAVYACEGCHTAGGAQAKETAHKPEHMAQHNATNMDCTSCHSFSAAAGVPTDISSATIHKAGCSTCHSGAATTTAQQKAKLFIAGAKGQNNPVYNCEDCHVTIHLGWEAKHQPVFPADPTMNCASCHNNYLPNEHTKYFGTGSSSVAYKVFRSTAGSGPWTEIGSTSATSYADTGLTANTSYYYKIQAYDGKPNYSGDSNTASVKTLSSSSAATTVDPDEARYASGNNGDSSSDPNSTTDVLSRLTDNSYNTYYPVRENGSSDQYIFIKLNREAKDYSRVELKMTVRYNNSGNLVIYPYSSDTGINNNSTYVVDGPYHYSSSNYMTETIDVTKAARAMDGLGWMKFRIKPDPRRSSTVYVADVQVVLTQNAVSGGTASNPPGTLPSAPNDTTAPTAPMGLTGTSNYYDRIDLTWTASSDQGAAAGESSTCVLCHGSNARADAKAAVSSHNANCSACHVIHADITTAHSGPALPTTPWACSQCHSNVVSLEHSANATMQQNSSLNCDTCHKSTLAKVQAAIHSTATDGSNLRCEACHTGTVDGVPQVHSDIASPHLSGIFPTATDVDCLKCHTAQAAEFASTKGGYHVVNDLTSKAAAGYGQYLSPWTSSSIVGCQGCHGDNHDGKAQAANILKRSYTPTSNSGQSDMLCYLCHDRNTYGGGGGTGKTGFSSGSNNLHNIGDHRRNGVLQCSWCHSSVPHGTNKAHLIVTKSDPNSTGSLLTNFYHPASGQYRASSCGSDSGSCDEHRGY